MGLFKNLFNKKNSVPSNSKIESKHSDDEDEITAVIAAVLASMDDEEETVAAISAVIACILGKSTSDFVVRNIKRTPELDSIWAFAGRAKLMR